MTTTWVQEYLNILRLPQETPSFSYLQRICTAHLSTFAFENLSKLMYYHNRTQNHIISQTQNHFIVPPIETFIENYKRYNFGGTCFTLNTNLLCLLKALAFNCQSVMLSEKHMAILVRLPELSNERLYVDCGGAAPFFHPVRFETDRQNVSAFAGDEVHIRENPLGSGLYTYTRYRNGEASGNAWMFDLNRTSEESDFCPIIEQANQPGTTFMSMLRCQLWQLDKGRSVSLVNNVLTIRHARGVVETQTLSSVEEIIHVMDKEFNLPLIPVQEALRVLDKLGVDVFNLSA